MNVTEALWLYAELAEKHGLEDWKIVLDTRTETRAGLCSYRKRTISISKWFVEQAPADEIRNVMLHEIAHALVGPGKGHGPIWKAKARQIGCTGDRCHTVPNKARKAPKYYAECQCGLVHEKRKLVKFGVYTCRRIGQPLTWKVRSV